MIGQIELINKIDKIITHKLPVFSIITGQRGQGKKLIANYISNKLKYPLITFDIKIDDIREMIKLAYIQTEPIIYLIPDADRMSIGAKNSLLKIIEEPPNNAYFIMTLQSIDNTLPTIKSRCIEFKMDNYSDEDLNGFIDLMQLQITDEEKNILITCCDNYRDIELFNNYGIIEFYNYVTKVITNIHKVQSANAFKICEKLDLKADSDKYDLQLFFKTFRSICYRNMIEHLFEPIFAEQVRLFSEAILITSKTLNKLTITGINKQSLLDMWILDIRKSWRT